MWIPTSTFTRCGNLKHISHIASFTFRKPVIDPQIDQIILSFYSLLGPKPGHRLPWSQVLGEKLAPLAVGYTQRVPYLLLHNKLSIPNSQGSSQLLTLSIPSILEGWTSHLFYPIKVLGWVPPGLNQVEPVPKGAKCQQPGLRKSEPAKVLQKAHQSSKRLVVLR